MFDGLKDKLNSFTSDVEEDADVEDGEADSQAADSEATGEPVESEQEETPPAGATAEAESSEPSTDEATTAEPATDADTGKPEPEPEPEPADPDAESAEESTDDTGEDEDDDSRGLAERAKLFATGKTVIDEDDLEAHLEELEFALLGSDVEMSVAQEILDGVEENLVGETRRRLESTGNLVTDAVREALYDVISVGQFDFDERVQDADKPVTIIFTGVNGVGKTTTIAKLAHYLEERQRRGRGAGGHGRSTPHQ